MINKLNTNLIKSTLKFIIICFLFASCGSAGNGTNGAGTISDAKNFLCKETGGNVTDVELIHTVHVEERIYNNDFILDGTVFWKGESKVIPTHDVLYFRGYSTVMDSYVFLQFNDMENTKNYYTPFSYNNQIIEKEKAAVRKLLANTEELLKYKNIEITNIYYQRFTENNDLDKVYKLSENFFKEYLSDYEIIVDKTNNFKGHKQFWIMIETSELSIETYEEIEQFKLSLAAVFDDVENSAGISIAICPAGGDEITVYKGA